MEGPVVLLACADEDSRMVFSAALRHAGYDVRVAPDAESTIAMAAASRPSLVITNFPTFVQGRTLTEVLRGDARTATVPILNVTSHVLPWELECAAAAGVTASLMMPVHIPDLLSKVQYVIAAR